MALNPVIPKNLFKKNLADIEAEKEERRKQKVDAVRSQYEGEGVKKKRFDLQTEQRPNKFEKKKEKVLKEYDDQLQFNMKHARPLPDFEKIEAPIKLNAAAVLREGLALKKKEE